LRGAHVISNGIERRQAVTNPGEHATRCSRFPFAAATV
jgi:hypothetical protein